MQKGLIRCVHNPILTVKDVRPSRPDFTVKGIFNCAAARLGNEYILLCRVAEAVFEEDPDCLSFPVVKRKNGEAVFESVRMSKRAHPEYDFSDPRGVLDARGKAVCLTTLSTLRLARSRDGIHFRVDEEPCLMPDAESEARGMEDPRITRINGRYYISYTAVSPRGACAALISTDDFSAYKRQGIIFPPENKDVCLFPERIGDQYFCLNRPVPTGIGSPDIWLASSPDLEHWGHFRHLYGGEAGWEGGRTGGGAPPIKTEKGWLCIYHAADRENRYCLGALLLDVEHPERILAKSRLPLMEPETDYETGGFFGGVVFSCGLIEEGEKLYIYYGASDESINRADIALADLFSHLGV